MAVIVLTSACGAPGVTTTTLGLAITWYRPAIAVEADPVGGSSMLAGYFQGFHAPTQSMVDLLLAHRNGRLAEQFPLSLIGVEGTSASVLPGPRSHAQARGALDLWEPLSLLWKTGDADVLVDAGRLGMESAPTALLRSADLVLLVTRSDLPSLAAAKQWAEQVAETRQAHPESPEWKILLIGAGHPYSTREVSEVLGLPVAATLCLDEKGASAYSAGTSPRRPRLEKDLVTCGIRVRETLDANTMLLAPKGIS